MLPIGGAVALCYVSGRSCRDLDPDAGRFHHEGGKTLPAIRMHHNDVAMTQERDIAPSAESESHLW